jgi:maltose O-acetyltransferase
MIRTFLGKLLRGLKFEILMWFELIIMVWPSTITGNRLRALYWNKKLSSMGKSPLLLRGTRFVDCKSIKIGDRFVLGENAVVNAGLCKGIYIGSDVSIARGCFLRSSNHRFDRLDIPIQEQGHDYKIIRFLGREYSIVIENGVLVGAHVVILSGAKIGQGSVIAAGSVVSSEIPPYSIVVGNPARVIRKRKREGV